MLFPSSSADKYLIAKYKSTVERIPQYVENADVNFDTCVSIIDNNETIAEITTGIFATNTVEAIVKKDLSFFF